MSAVPTADDYEEVLPGVFRWEVYSPHHQVRLTSHAFLWNGRLTLFDPIALRGDRRLHLLFRAKTSQIFLTSGNHWRATDEWIESDLPVVSLVSAGLDGVKVLLSDDAAMTWEGFVILPLEGGALGECVVLHPETKLAFGGDSLVNLPGRGLEVLPEKYCRDQPALVRALTDACNRPIDQWFPAHGNPIGPDASRILAGLLSRWSR
jgi:glyoxylase-like metal-dependent hydrolase (beta-lactamase superfamily II)